MPVLPNRESIKLCFGKFVPGFVPVMTIIVKSNWRIGIANKSVEHDESNQGKTAEPYEVADLAFLLWPHGHQGALRVSPNVAALL